MLKKCHVGDYVPKGSPLMDVQSQKQDWRLLLLIPVKTKEINFIVDIVTFFSLFVDAIINFVSRYLRIQVSESFCL
jgi:hypothetical protein